MTASTTEEELRIELAAAFRLAAIHDLHEGIANHFSALLPDDRHFLVNPFGLHFTEIRASDLLVLGLDGNVVRGRGIPAPSAKHIHAPIHRLCPHARVLMHSHQPYATALTMTGEGRLQWALQTTVRFYGRVGYDTDYDGVALGDDVGDRLAKAISAPVAGASRESVGTEVLMMGNHGVMTIAPTVAQAYDDLYFLERAAKTQLLAQASGQPLRILDRDMVERTAAQSTIERFDHGYVDAHFSALVRLLDRTDRSYRD